MSSRRPWIPAFVLVMALGVAPSLGCANNGSSSDVGADTAIEDATADVSEDATELVAPDTITDSSSDSSLDFEPSTSEDAVNLLEVADLFSNRDLDWSYAEVAATITLSNTGTFVEGDNVSVVGSTITISAAGTYLVSGTLTDGQLIVDADASEKVQIVLNGAHITCSSSAALYVRSADKVFVTLADGTQNSLSTTGAFVAIDANSIDGAIFSKDDLTINGTGSLQVSSAQGHGIVVKDDLVLVLGTIDVDAADHAIQVNDSVAIASGSYTLTAGTDGIHCANDEDASLGYIYVGGGTILAEVGSDGFDAGGVLQVDGGQITVSAGDDGLHAEYAVAINGGTITVVSSVEALEGSSVTITGGTLSLTSSDDGINAVGEPTSDAYATNWWFDRGGGLDATDETAFVLISGGHVTIDARGDGIDSNGDLTFTGGETYISGPTNSADGALDYAGEGTITGGTLVAAGAMGMAMNLGSTSTQGTMLVSASGSAGDTITLFDSEGTQLATFTPTASYQCVVVSAQGVVSGGTYTLTWGSSSTEVTMEGIATTLGSSQMGGSGGGMGFGDGGGGIGVHGQIIEGPQGMGTGTPQGMGDQQMDRTNTVFG